MCSFGVTSVAKDLLDVNYFAQFRGPDDTEVLTIENIQFIHNALYITGDRVSQPFYKDGIVIVFNGEIYNYQEHGDYKSEVDAIFNAYVSEGAAAFRSFDGEFALCLVDFPKDKIIFTTDTFATKPLWYDFTGSCFGVATYKSQLVGLGFTNPALLEANTTCSYSLTSGCLIEKTSLTDFSIAQFKTNYDDWTEAFCNSIAKRSEGAQYPIFIGLSSGYDSGAIACELKQQNTRFTSYCIAESENLEIINQRKSVLGDVRDIDFNITKAMYFKVGLKRRCEQFTYSNEEIEYSVHNDPGAIGLAAICDQAKKDGGKIYFSGQGADEIFSDYGFNGNTYLPYSNFGGIFPSNLRTIWPWKNVFSGSQIQFLNKEEVVAGAYGLETRYPFLDKAVVQEFLHLTVELKNRIYKSVLDDYLEEKKFPFDRGKKIGFNPLGALM